MAETTLNRLAVCSNQFQGTTLKVLCVCSAGLLRSPTMANVLHRKYGFNTRAVGATLSYALIPIDEVLVQWADEIWCASFNVADEIEPVIKKAGIDKDDLVVLSIPDIYEYMDKKLIAEIERQADDKICGRG